MPENPNTIYETAVQLSEDEEAELELATLKTRDNFETYFTEDVTDIRAITYSDSPETLLNLLQDIGTDDVNLEVVVGDNTLDYRKKLRGKEQLAEKLERLQRENRLRIYLASLRSNEVHSKLYILQHEDGSRTNILGSPNLSEQGWGSTRQKNAIAVFKTNGNQPLDNVFDTWYEDHKTYADQFMQDLTDQLEDIDDEEREEIIHAWVDGRTTSQEEEAELEQELTERLDEANVEKATIIGEFEDPDLTLAVNNNENQADQTISQSLNGFNDLLSELREDTRAIDASIDGKTLRASPGAISKHSKEKFGAPKMWFNSDDKLILQTESARQLELTRELPDEPEKIDQALEYLEQYFQTVDKFGRTDHPEAVKAQMWEAIIWFFWAPFINRYAAVYKDNGIDLDKYLPSLYVYGEPGSGKGTLTRYAFHLLSNGHVTEPEDGDSLNKTNLTRVRRVDSTFPVVFDDIDPNDLDIETYLNFRQKHWTGEVDIPALAFISNDNLPRSRIQHRAKILNFDIQFKDTHQTAKYVNDLTERSNPLFTWFAEIFKDRDVIMRSQDADTLAEARQVFKELYNRANRELPSYFPEEPAEKKYDIGKWMWEDAYESGLVEFQRRNGNLIAKFDDSLSVYSSVRKYARTLPNEARAQQDGNQIQIKAEETLEDWFPFNINEDKGLVSRFL
ncbi:phospholipase D family protein [Haloarcula argentinensis]|uniref:Phospholipase D-like domain-containing protein n=1 Tax=Haloarcula argentinensis TaxID=43776 RepID=A0A847UN25_HALAR|nr:phospholipase D family protein [Haloarcula argentinensis]NLV13214.1 hypothetical protein [Haloarcula argentinensis]